MSYNKDGGNVVAYTLACSLLAIEGLTGKKRRKKKRRTGTYWRCRLKGQKKEVIRRLINSWIKAYKFH